MVWSVSWEQVKIEYLWVRVKTKTFWEWTGHSMLHGKFTQGSISLGADLRICEKTIFSKSKNYSRWNKTFTHLFRLKPFISVISTSYISVWFVRSWCYNNYTIYPKNKCVGKKSKVLRPDFVELNRVMLKVPTKYSLWVDMMQGKRIVFNAVGCCYRDVS